MPEIWSDNPAYAGRTPEPLEPACHDRSPMLDVQCSACNGVNHVHETQIATFPTDATLGMRCQYCAHVNMFPIEGVRDGFAELRRRGWIA